MRKNDRHPLLQRPSTASNASNTSYKSIGTARSLAAAEAGGRHEQRVDDDTIPETAVLGRTLGWSSAYLLITSRVIGSGVFATPGVIFRSVNSIGLSLTLWVAGAIVSWFGLMVTLEYGCMLPRSGGMRLLRSRLTGQA